MGRLTDRAFAYLPLLASCLAAAAVYAQAPDTIIGGRVTDNTNHPVAHVRVNLRDNETGKTQSDSTDSQGRFEFFRPPCGSCALEFDPPEKSRLAMALIDYIPGNRTRQFAIHLRHGFSLAGRVTHQGRGLKGLFVQALPSGGNKETDDAVHGGGFTTTGGNGAFRLLLTPGTKMLKVKNNRYPDLAPELTLPVDVISDTHLPDLALPGKAQ